MIHSPNVTNLEGAVSPLVNVERITSIDVIKTLKVNSNSNSPKNEIIFTMAQDPKSGVVGQIKWQYALPATLDSDYLLIINSISTVVA